MYVQRFMLHPAIISIFVQAAACWKLLQFANIFQKSLCAFLEQFFYSHCLPFSDFVLLDRHGNMDYICQVKTSLEIIKGSLTGDRLTQSNYCKGTA